MLNIHEHYKSFFCNTFFNAYIIVKSKFYYTMNTFSMKYFVVTITIFYDVKNKWRANIQSGLTHKSGVKTGRVA